MEVDEIAKDRSCGTLWLKGMGDDELFVDCCFAYIVGLKIVFGFSLLFLFIFAGRELDAD